MDRLTLDVDQVAKLLGISRSGAYEAIRRGDLPVLRLGRRYVVPKDALMALLAEPPGTGPDRAESTP